MLISRSQLVTKLRSLYVIDWFLELITDIFLKICHQHNCSSLEYRDLKTSVSVTLKEEYRLRSLPGFDTHHSEIFVWLLFGYCKNENPCGSVFVPIFCADPRYIGS